MNPVARISAEKEKDEPERNEYNAYNKAPDQNAGKDFQIAYETRRFIHFFFSWLAYRKNSVIGF